MTGENKVPLGDHVGLLCWTDLVGLIRCRGVPAHRLHATYKTGMGWAAAGLSLTTFETPASSPWGPMTEVRQIPVKSTETVLNVWADASPFHLVLCEALTQNGDPWECCPRQILKKALETLKSETGLLLLSAVEHEFTLSGADLSETTSFSIESMRQVEGFWRDLARAFAALDMDIQTLEPEAGLRQYEVTCGPRIGLESADHAILIREIIREAARRRGYHASFSPKPFEGKIGSGAHLHFSFIDGNGRNVTSGADPATQMSPLSQSFCSGVIKHLPEIATFFASSPISYSRLGAGNWSCGYASFGIQNREAALRVCPPPKFSSDHEMQGFNLEFRALDAASNTYLALAAIIYAGLSGIRQKLPAPVPIDKNPAQLTTAQREQLGIKPIPATLKGALDEALKSPLVRGSFGPTFMLVLEAVLSKEIELAEELTHEQFFDHYLRVF